MKETTWITKENEVILSIANKLDNFTSSTFVEFSINEIIPINFRVHINSPIAINGFSQLFEPAIESCTNWIDFYFDMSGSKLKLNDLLPETTEIKTPCIGLFDESNKIGLLAGDNAFGLLKSTIIGVYSFYMQPYGFFPAHSAVLEYKGQGILFVGVSGVGKTTTIFNLFDYFPKGTLKMLTDDWSVLSQNDKGQFKIKSIEKKLSYKVVHIKENKTINLQTAFDKNKISNISKVYANPSEIFGDNVFVDTTTLQTIVLLKPTKSEKITFQVDKNETFKTLIDTSYHMPNCNENYTKEHYRLINNCVNNSKLVGFETRHSLQNRDKIYTKLMEFLQ